MNNPFNTKYCSLIIRKDDDLNMRSEGISFMREKVLEGRIWIFPPKDLQNPVIKIIKSLPWSIKKGKLEILLLLSQSKALNVMNFLRFGKNKLDYVCETFQKSGKKPDKVQIKLRETLILFRIGKLA